MAVERRVVALSPCGATPESSYRHGDARDERRCQERQKPPKAVVTAPARQDVSGNGTRAWNRVVRAAELGGNAEAAAAYNRELVALTPK